MLSFRMASISLWIAGALICFPFMPAVSVLIFWLALRTAAREAAPVGGLSELERPGYLRTAP